MNKIVTSPLTNTSNVSLIKTYKIDDIINRWQSGFGIDIKNEFVNKEEDLFFYKCLDSGLFFFEPKYEGSSNLYKELQSRFSWYYLEDKWEYKVALKEIKNYKTIIEIGCGKGTFIKKLQKKSKSSIIGLEYNEEAVKEANKAKLPVYLKDIDSLFSKPNNNVDVILAFQVLEHISNPLPFLQKHISHLNIGGKLIICVPNYNCFYKFSDELLDMPPHHNTKWSKESFKYLEELFPIKLKKIKYEPLFYMHINIWLRNYSNHYKKNKWYGKFIFNRYTIPLYRFLLNTKLRNLIRGHSIYVSFEKIK